MTITTEKYTEGMCGDGAAILRDGVPMTVSEILDVLNAASAREAVPVAYIFKHPAGKLFWTLTDESNKDQSDVMPVYTTPSATSAAGAVEFIPKNLDKALAVVGVAIPESREEFNFQTERYIQRLIDRVIRYSDEFTAPPAPAVPDNVREALTLALQAMEFMGDTLNNMDAVCSEDVEYVTPAFTAVRELLASEPEVND